MFYLSYGLKRKTIDNQELSRKFFKLKIKIIIKIITLMKRLENVMKIKKI